MSDKLLEAIGGISEQFIAECDDYISQRKASHRRRKLTRVTALCAAVIAGAALLTGAVYSIFRVSFPNSFANRTEHSAAIYDIEPFRMSIQLPAGVRDRKIGKRAGAAGRDGYKAERRKQSAPPTTAHLNCTTA